MNSDFNQNLIGIRPISYQETYLIRQEVLRPDRPLDTCHFLGDELSSTFHLGAFYQEKLVGIISVFENNNKLFKQENQYQIRGMALLPDYQKYGLGKKLIEYAEKLLKENNVSLAWCNAREIAVKFYEKSGYKIIGEAFDIPDVGIHWVMYNEL